MNYNGLKNLISRNGKIICSLANIYINCYGNKQTDWFYRHQASTSAYRDSLAPICAAFRSFSRALLIVCLIVGHHRLGAAEVHLLQWLAGLDTTNNKSSAWQQGLLSARLRATLRAPLWL